MCQEFNIGNPGPAHGSMVHCWVYIVRVCKLVGSMIQHASGMLEIGRFVNICGIYEVRYMTASATLPVPQETGTDHMSADPQLAASHQTPMLDGRRSSKKFMAMQIQIPV